MYIKKNYPVDVLIRFTGHHIVWLLLWSAAATSLYVFSEWDWLGIPWLPISLIGTAVAFYLGFKNNSSYDRMWEARKVWGAIVNSSRSWGTMVTHFVSNQFREQDATQQELAQIHQRIIYRHIAWLYTLRHQLLKPTPWEHSQRRITKKITNKRANNLTQLFQFDAIEIIHEGLLEKNEMKSIQQAKNSATQLIDRQAADLQYLRKEDYIDDFRHMQMQSMLDEFYIHQGKCERIKKFPFPRQYASISFYFVAIFIFLLPFGMVSEFKQLGDGLVWLTIPFTTIVGWVFLMMELVGDYSENPFELLANDIPMYSLCRTIEIDMREMLGEKDLPPPVGDKNGVLM